MKAFDELLDLQGPAYADSLCQAGKLLGKFGSMDVISYASPSAEIVRPYRSRVPLMRSGLEGKK